MNIDDIQKLNNQMIKTKRDLGTLASKIFDKSLYENKNVVKVITEESLTNINFPEAIGFSRKMNKSK